MCNCVYELHTHLLLHNIITHVRHVIDVILLNITDHFPHTLASYSVAMFIMYLYIIHCNLFGFYIIDYKLFGNKYRADDDDEL